MTHAQFEALAESIGSELLTLEEVRAEMNGTPLYSEDIWVAV
jgi:hypothetical protein